MSNLKALIKRLYSTMFSERLDISARLINIFYMCGLLIILTWGVLRSLTFYTPNVPLIMAGAALPCLIVLYLCNKRHMYTLCIYISVIWLGDVIFPFAMFDSGAVDGGMASYFLLSLVTIFLLARGKHLVILLSTHLAVIIGSYYYAYRFGEDIVRSMTRVETYRDTVASIIVVGVAVGAFVLLQRMMFEGESAKLAAAGERIRERSLLPRALNETAVTLIANNEENFEEAMEKGLQVVADATGLDRISIWKNYLRGEDLFTSEVYRWDRESGGSTAIPETMTGWRAMDAMPRWPSLLAKGDIINSPVSALPAQEAEVLSRLGVKSAFVAPVFERNVFWGFILMADHKTEHAFNEDHAEMMRTAAFLFANAIIREDMRKSVVEAEERARAMMESSPVGCTMFDDQLRPIDCNDTILRLYGIPGKQYYLDHFWELAPEYQPDGSVSVDKEIEHMQRAIMGERVSFEWLHMKPGGELLPAEVTLAPVRYEGGFALLGYCYDMRGINKMMENVQMQDAMLRTINKATATLINSAPNRFHEDLWGCLGMLADNVGADRVDIWKIYKKDGAQRARLLYEWAQGVPMERQLLMKADVLIAEAAPAWGVTLAKGETIMGITRQMPENARVTMASQQIQSILVVPVIMQGELWGFVGFDNCHSERSFTENEASILTSASLLIANALIRNENAESLRVRLEQQELTAQITTGFVSKGDVSALLASALERVGKYLGVNRVVLLEDGTFNVFKQWASNPAYNPESYDYMPNPFIGKAFPKSLPHGIPIPVFAVNDTEHDHDGLYVPFLEIDMRAFVWAPLYVDGRLWGVISAEQCDKPRAWSESEKSFIALMGSTMAGAITRGSYEKALSARLAQQELMSEISQDFVSSGNIKSAIETAMARLGKYLNTTRVVLAVPEETGDWCYFPFQWAVSHAFRHQDRFYGANDYVRTSFPNEMPESSRILFIAIDDMAEYIKTDPNGVMFLNSGSYAAVWTPIYTDGKLYGTMAVEHCLGPRRWTEDETHFICTVANTIAAAFSRARYEEQLNDSVSRQAVMGEISQRLIERGDISTMVHNAIKRVGEYFSVSRIVVVVRDEQEEGGHKFLFGWRAGNSIHSETGGVGFGKYIDEVRALPYEPGGSVPVVAVDNVLASENGKYAGFSAIGVRSFMWAPLYAEGEFYGVLSIERFEDAKAWTREDRAFAGALAVSLSGLIARDEYLNRLDERYEEQRILSEISQELVAAGDAAALISDALERAGRYLGAHRLTVVTLNPSSDTYRLPYYWFVDEAHRPGLSGSGVLELVSSEFPMVADESAPPPPSVAVEDIAVDQGGRFAQLKRLGFKAFVAVPLYVEGTLFGILNVVECDSPRKWTADNVRFAETVGGGIASFLARESYNRELALRLSQQSISASITQSFLEERDTQSKINGALERVGKFIGASRVAVSHIDEENASVQILYAWYGENENPADVEDRFRKMFQALMQDGDTREHRNVQIFCGDVNKEYEGRFAKASERFGLKSFISVPLQIGGKHWGMLTAICRDEQKTWTDNEKQMISTLTSAIIGAIERDRYEDELNERLAQRALLSEITQSFVDRGDIGRLLESALEKFSKHLRIQRALVVTWDEAQETHSVRYHYISKPELLPPLEAKGFIKHVVDEFPERMTTGLSSLLVSCADVTEDKDGTYAIFADIGVKAFIWAPLYINGRLYGILTAEECETRRDWTEDEIAFTATVSSSMASAMTREAFEQELDKRLTEQALSGEITGAFVAKGDITEMTEYALARVGSYLRVHRCIVLYLDALAGVNRLLYKWYQDESYAHATDVFDLRDMVLESFPDGRQSTPGMYTLCCADTAAENEGKFAALSAIGVRAFVWSPIYVDGGMWGMLAIDQCDRARDWQTGELRVIDMLANSLSSMITRGAYEDMLNRRVNQQALLSEISQSFVSGENAREMTEDAVAKIGQFLGVSRVMIVVPNHEERCCNTAYSWFSSPEYVLPEVQEGVDCVIAMRFPQKLSAGVETPVLWCDDLAKAEEFAPIAELGIRACVWSALYMEGRFWGLLTAEMCEEPRAWTEGEKQLIGLVATSIAGALTRDAAEREREDALDKAIQASKAKGEFLSNMSHEMRTPMNAIIGMTAIGKAADDLDRKNYAFGKIEDASTHLLGVINDVLDMSKIEANKLELSDAEFNFEKMLQKVVNVVNFRVDEKHQEFYVSVDSAIPRSMIGDDQRLAQVVTNLLSNAVKFTPEGGKIQLNAFYLGDEDGLCELQLEVIDSGIGISPEQQSKLFRSFQQAESNTSRRFGGTGLGLAISKRIVELMGGRIWIESELGGGSKFAFTIKAERGREEYKSLLAPGVNWGNLRLLAVDDVPEVREYFLNLSNQFGVKCDVAADGEDALRLIDKNGDYDIYFVDWRMPHMDGIELTRHIRAKSPETKSVVTMISGAELGGVSNEAKAAGVDKFLTKPLFSSSIADCINECLGMSNLLELEETQQMDTFPGKKILLAEDVEINREIVMAMLEPTLLEIDTAENGAYAVKAFQSAPDKYDMIFMDLQMPEMDGLSATRAIRALPHPRARTIPIVAMTANVFREDVENCVAAGMNDHVGKPLNMEEVLDKLRTFVGGKKRPEAAEQKPADNPFAWRKSLSTGDEHMDSDHKRLLKLMSEFEDACARSAGESEIQERLDFLSNFAERHLKAEEDLMRANSYPKSKLKTHMERHNEFREKVSSLSKENRANIPLTDVAAQVFDLAAKWYRQHVTEDDTALAEFLKLRS